MTTKLFWRFPSDAGTWSCATAAANYPASNLGLPHANSAEALKDDGTSTAFRVVVDMGAAYTVSAFAALAHDIPATATNLKVQANSSDSWGSPAFSHDCTYRADAIVEFFAEQTYRYWSFTLTKASAATILTIARMLFGPAFDFTQMPSEKSVEWGGDEDTDTKRTKSGASYSDVAAHLKTLRFRVEFMPQTQKDELATLSQTIGLHSPFCVSLDPTNKPVEGFLYGKLSRLLTFRDRVWTSSTLYDTDIEMVEEK